MLGENVLQADTKEPPSHTEGEHVAMKNDTEKLESDKVEEEPTNAVLISTVKPTETLTPEKLILASKVVREDPDEPVRVPYMINVKMHYLTNDGINAHMEKENLIKTAAEEAKMFEMTKTEIHPQSSGRKIKHMELEPKIKVPGLECNRSLPEGVFFVNNMVIEESKYGIFFTDVSGDQAFQRWNDIHKVGVDSLVSYLVMASMIKTLENAIFDLKLKKLIVEHPDQKKL
ncbi:hypothetical protein Tco_1232773 [Tanacetum coccineum]